MQQPEHASGRTVGSGRSDDAEQAQEVTPEAHTHNPFPPASPGFVALFPAGRLFFCTFP